MNTEISIVPSYLLKFKNQKVAQLLAIFMGISFLAFLSQVKINLWFTPVPITGQTFGVSVLALFFGEKLGGGTFLAYLICGFIGAPIFAGGASGLIIGPTFGYLVGMLVAVIVIGKFSRKINQTSFFAVLMITYLGSICIFLFGVIGLLQFVPKEQVLSMGVIPFLPGDLLKNILGCLIFIRFNKNCN